MASLRLRPRPLPVLFTAAALVASLASAAGAGDADTSRRDADSPAALRFVESKLHHGQQPAKVDGQRKAVTRNFKVLGHLDFANRDTHADVFVHRGFAYVGTWRSPCTSNGVKIVDVRDPRRPRSIGTLGGRFGTSAEDMVVRRVSTSAFTGDLLAVGLQRCGDAPGLNKQKFGAQFWDVTDPYHPVKLSGLPIVDGFGGVHELDLVQRGRRVYALLATPFTEWFDPQNDGEFRIVDVTNPRRPRQVGQWGAAQHGMSPGPLYGQGSFGSRFAHSVRASANGRKAYVSYWDLGVLTLDISNVRRPRLLSSTNYSAYQDGDAHSVSVYRGRNRTFLLQNDEDFDPRSPAELRTGGRRIGPASESPAAPALWLEAGRRVTGRMVDVRNHGCRATDYPAATRGAIAVVRTPFSLLGNPRFEPDCSQGRQERTAQRAGAIAVIHDFRSPDTSPQWFTIDEVDIPVVFAWPRDARALLAAGHGTIRARRPSWGYLRIYDAATGVQVSKFDDVPNVHSLRAPPGGWSIHNNEVVGDRSFVSWYSNGIVALDLTPLNRAEPRDPVRVGRFVPPGRPDVWGVVVNRGLVYASDLNSGLWILRPTGRAAP